MPAFKRVMRRKAAKAAVKHTTHGVAAKVQRKPLRSATLLAIGGVLGAGAGWFLGRTASVSTAS